MLDVSQGPGLSRGRGLEPPRAGGLRHGRAGLRLVRVITSRAATHRRPHSAISSAASSSCSKASAASVWPLPQVAPRRFQTRHLEEET